MMMRLANFTNLEHNPKLPKRQFFNCRRAITIDIKKEMRKELKTAVKSDLQRIIEEAAPNSMQIDIIKLRYFGYDPADFPHNDYLRMFRKGTLLSRNQVGQALNVSENVITSEMNKLFKKLEKIGFLEWRQRRG